MTGNGADHAANHGSAKSASDVARVSILLMAAAGLICDDETTHRAEDGAGKRTDLGASSPLAIALIGASGKCDGVQHNRCGRRYRGETCSAHSPSPPLG